MRVVHGDSDASLTRCNGPDGWVMEDGDCNDGDASVHPDADEICGDAVDQDCDGEAVPCEE